MDTLQTDMAHYYRSANADCTDPVVRAYRSFDSNGIVSITVDMWSSSVLEENPDGNRVDETACRVDRDTNWSADRAPLKE